MMRWRPPRGDPGRCDGRGSGGRRRIRSFFKNAGLEHCGDGVIRSGTQTDHLRAKLGVRGHVGRINRTPRRALRNNAGPGAGGGRRARPFPARFLKTSFKPSPGLWRRRGRAGRPELTSPCNAGSHTGLSRPGGGSGTSQRPRMGRGGRGRLEAGGARQTVTPLRTHTLEINPD